MAVHKEFMQRALSSKASAGSLKSERVWSEHSRRRGQRGSDPKDRAIILPFDSDAPAPTRARTRQMTKLSHHISHPDVDNPPKGKREFVQPAHMFDRGACVAAVPVRRPTFVRSEAAMSLVSSERATGIVRLGPATARRRFGGNGQPRPPGGRPASSSPRGRAASPPPRARMSVVGTTTPCRQNNF